jgi:signal transduction histidine kinase
VLVVTDDGVGIPATPRAEGRGLANMARRAERWGGALQLAGGPAGGLVLTWRVPLRAG